MQQIDEPRFAKALDALAALFSRELDGPAIFLYWQAVQSTTIEKFESAVLLAASQCEHFPPPARLLGLIEPDTAKMKAVEAWPEVMKLATRSKGDHSDPIAAEAIRLMGGGKQLGQRNLDELEKWGRKEFVDLYEEIATRERPMPDALPPGMPDNLLGV